MPNKELEISIGSLFEVFLKGQDRVSVCFLVLITFVVKIDFNLSFDTGFAFP